MGIFVWCINVNMICFWGIYEVFVKELLLLVLSSS